MCTLCFWCFSGRSWWYPHPLIVWKFCWTPLVQCETAQRTMAAAVATSDAFPTESWTPPVVWCVTVALSLRSYMHVLIYFLTIRCFKICFEHSVSVFSHFCRLKNLLNYFTQHSGIKGILISKFISENC